MSREKELEDLLISVWHEFDRVTDPNHPTPVYITHEVFHKVKEIANKKE